MSDRPFVAYWFTGTDYAIYHGDIAARRLGDYLTLDDAFRALRSKPAGGYVLDRETGDWRGSCGPPLADHALLDIERRHRPPLLRRIFG